MLFIAYKTLANNEVLNQHNWKVYSRIFRVTSLNSLRLSSEIAKRILRIIEKEISIIKIIAPTNATIPNNPIKSTKPKPKC